MATRNFVPRSGSEGQIGTLEKPWGVVTADIGHFGTLSGSISSSITETGSFGHVYAAGNIYAAGEVSADSFVSRDGNNTISFQDDVAFGADDSITSILNITASNDISASGNIYGTNLLADSASFSTRITTAETELEETIISASAQLAEEISGSFSAPSASFSTRITNLKSDSGSFSTRVTNLKSDSGSFSTRITDIVGGDITLTHVTSSGDVLFQSDLTVDGKVTAQEFHTEVVSSSIIFSSGSTIFGDTSDDTHRFTGSLKVTETGSFNHLIVLGNITASGVVRADAFESVTGGTAIDFNDSLNITGNLTASGDLSIDDLTASGNISGSVTSTGSFHHIKSNKIQSTDNGGLRLFEHGGSGIFVEDGGRVGIGDLTPESTLKVTGDLTVSTNITASNDLAVSGIAGIGGAPISGNALTVNGTNNVLRLRHTGAPATSNRVNIDFSTNNAGTRNMYIETMNNSANGNSMMTIGGYFNTAVGGYADVLQIGAPDSGNTKALVISGSAASTGSFGRVETAGDINSDGRIYEQDTSVIDHATAMAIVFGG